jgi:hypothetical protein
MLSAFTNTETALRIGVINYHDDFTRILLSLLPRHHEVIVYNNLPPPPADRINGAVDLLINHHEGWYNDMYDVPTIVQPYGTVKSSHIKRWNTDPKIVGVLDMSGMLTAKFPELRVPVFSFTPSHPFCLTYEKAGDKVISLILQYEIRFPAEFRMATSIADELVGAESKDFIHEKLKVRDLDALKDAKWLLHIKHDGFVCNAVVKALACGVPVLMDTKTYENCAFEGIVRHDHNAIVLPADELKEFLATCPPETYERIKQTCVEEAWRYRRPMRWCDGWWRSA